MPIIASAKKALRRDQRRTQVNRRLRHQIKSALDQVVETKKAGDLAVAYRALDRAAKNHVIHPNKAARLKSRLTKKVAGKAQ
jgi:small subunit ribosomal protein S20